MKIRDMALLILAAATIVFLRCHFMSGLYYDIDVACRAYTASHFLQTKSMAFLFQGLIPPGSVLIYALAFLMFGLSFVSVQIMALIFDLAGICALYFFSRCVVAKEARFYFVLPLLAAPFLVSEALQGHSANIETFLIPFEICAGLFLGLGAQRKNNFYYGAAGAVLGAAFLIKQTVLSFWAAGFLFILLFGVLNKEGGRAVLRRLAVFFSTFALPFAAAALGAAASGRLLAFIESKIFFLAAYLLNVSFLKQVYLEWAFEQMFKGLRLEIVLLGLLALAGLLLSLRRWRSPERILLVLWFAVPFLAVSLGGPHLRHHYLEIAIPLLALAIAGFCDIYGILAQRFNRTVFPKVLFLVLGLISLGYVMVHSPLALVKRHPLDRTFLLTQRYLIGPVGQKDRSRDLLLTEDYDSARRFFIGRYIADRAPKDETILVWDYLAGGAVYFWAGRDPVLFFPDKAVFLPRVLKDPIAAILYRPSKEKYFGYHKRQDELMERLLSSPPFYIVIVKSAKPMPHAPPIEKTLREERGAFPDLFGFLNGRYELEQEYYGCDIYRRRT